VAAENTRNRVRGNTIRSFGWVMSRSPYYVYVREITFWSENRNRSRCPILEGLSDSGLDFISLMREIVTLSRCSPRFRSFFLYISTIYCGHIIYVIQFDIISRSFIKYRILLPAAYHFISVRISIQISRYSIFVTMLLLT